MALNKKQQRFISACLGFGLCTTTSLLSSAQDAGLQSGGILNLKMDTTVVESPEKFPVITNNFWNNWFGGIAAGAQIYFSDHDKQMKFGERITPAFEIYAGKWFSPGIGVRAGFGGFKAKGATQNGSHGTGEVYDAVQGLQKQEVDFRHAHLDVLLNLTNVLAGYQADRFYTVSPYLGLGWIHATTAPRENEVTANIGVYNTFRISKPLDFTFDLRGSFVNDRFDGEIGNRRGEGLLIATAGVAYKFKEQGWSKPSTTIIKYDEAELIALSEKVNALERDNDALKKQLSEAKDKSVTDLKLENKVLAAPILITFPIGKSIVSNEARVNLGFFAQAIKSGNGNVVYKVTGYADKGTGTVATNQRLSKKRAEAIYNVLVKEFGVSPQQLQVVHAGGVDNMYYNDPRLSRAVITIAN